MLTACVWSLQAAATHIDLSPSTTNTTVGSSFSVDVLISGLSAATPALAVTDYDLFISYSSSLMNASGVVFGTGLGGPADSISGSDLSIPGVAELFAISFDPYATLRGLQGDSFKLATLNFLALAPTPGSSLAFVQNLSFVVDLINMDEDPINGANPAVCQPLSCVSIGGGRVVIREGGTAPEPTPLLLFAAAALALVIARGGGRLSR